MWFGKYTLPGTLRTLLQNRYTVAVQFTLFPPPHSILHPHPNSTIPVICPGQFSSPPSFCMSFLVQPLVLCCFILLLPSAVYCRWRELHFPLSYPSPLPGSIRRWVRSIAGLLLCLLVVVSFFSPFSLTAFFYLNQKVFLLPSPNSFSTPTFVSSPSHNFLRTRDAFLTLRPPPTPRHSTNPYRNVGIFLCLPYVKQNILLASSPQILPLSSFTDFDSKFYFLLHLARV